MVGETEPEEGSGNRGINPSQFKVTEGKRLSAFDQLDRLALRLKEVAEDTAALVEKHGFSSATIHVGGDGQLEGSIFFKNPQASGQMEIHLEGPLGRDFADIPRGTPFTAANFPEQGVEVYFRPAPERPLYAQTGDTIVKGQTVLYAVYDKNVMWLVVAPLSGKITYAVEHGQKVYPKRQVREGDEFVEKEADILFYIDPTE